MLLDLIVGDESRKMEKSSEAASVVRVRAEGDSGPEESWKWWDLTRLQVYSL